MLKRLLSLILLYSLLTISTAGPAFASATNRIRDKKLAAKRTNKSFCASCPEKEQGKTLVDSIDNLATIGRTTRIQPLAPLHRSIFSGLSVNSVSTATGSLGFAVNDLASSGSMPVIFQRVYTSDRGEDLGLGKGWSFLFDDRITINGETATLAAGDGSVLAFRDEDKSGRFVLSTPEPQSRKTFGKQDDTITEQHAGLTRLYKKVGNAYRLAQITDANRNSINIGFDARGNLSRITSNSGTLALEWSNAKNPRLLSVTDNGGRRVTFKQSSQGLRTMTDAGGNEWTYDYSAEGLIRATDPLGRVLLRAQYDDTGRVIEAGDGAGVSAFEYEPTSAAVSRRTLVTDSLGIQTVYEHNENGALVAIYDDGGHRLLQIEHNAANYPTRFLTKADAANFRFDAQNRLIQSTTNDGSSKTYIYDERGRISSVTENGFRKDFIHDQTGNILAANASEPDQSYQAAYDARGRMLAIEFDGQRQTYEYDHAGNQIAFTTEKYGRFKTQRDTAGRVIKETYPSGLTIYYARNNRGMVIRKSDNRGRFVAFERDPSGALTEVGKSDGSWLRATRDQAGRIVALNSSTGAFRHFAYNSRGGLTEFSDSQGKHKRFTYDRRGRLGSIVDNEGNKTTIERNEKGGIERISSFRGEGWRYDYDRKGRLVAAKRIHGPISNAGEFLPIGYGPSTVLPEIRATNLQTLDCPFGTYLGFDPADHGWTNCWDPYGGYGVFGGGGTCAPDPFGFDPSFCSYGFGETLEECIARQNRMCQNARDACGANALSTALAAIAACVILLEARPEAAALCVAAIYLRLVADLGSCDLADRNCRLRIMDVCRR